jgi:methylated-DNA-[protein]-cysteine S-methyltransferase
MRPPLPGDPDRLSLLHDRHIASYAAVARQPSHPKAVGGAGTACVTNPLLVVLPCHRVVHSHGSMDGYLGGADAKRTLLTPEAAA